MAGSGKGGYQGALRSKCRAYFVRLLHLQFTEEGGNVKKVFCLAVVLVWLCSDSFGAEFAVDKGSTMVGVTAGFLNAHGDLYEAPGATSFTAILVTHQIAYMVVPRLGVGGDLLLFLTHQGPNKSTTLGVGPKLMYFFGGKEGKAYPFLTAGFYLVRNDVEYVGFWDGFYQGTRIKLGGGTNVMLSRHLSVLIEASYNFDQLTLEGERGQEDKTESGDMVIVTMGLAGFLF